MHTLRYRFCLDSRRRVRLLVTGSVDGDMVRGEVSASGITVTPPKHAALVTKCFKGARGMLFQEFERYMSRFSPTGAVDVSRVLRKT